MTSHINEILDNFNGTRIHSLTDILCREDQDNSDDSLIASVYVEHENINDFLHPFKNKFAVLSLNIQSLNAKYDDLQVLINDISKNDFVLSAICLQETWIHKNNSHFVNFPLPHYNMLYLDATISAHSGLCVYIHESFSYKIRNFNFSDNEWEGLFIDIQHPSHKHKITICNIYRPPRDNVEQINIFLNELTPILEQLNRENSEVILLGDFNLDLLMVNQKNIVSVYLNLMFTYGFIPTITIPTRIHNSATLIDNIFLRSTKHTCFYKTGVMISSVSDHLPIILCIDLSLKRMNYPKFFKSQTYNEQALSNFIDDVKISNFLSDLNVDVNADPNRNFEVFINTLNALIDKHFPVKLKRLKKRKHGLSPWISTGIIKSINYRDNLYKTLLLTPRTSQSFLVLKQNLKVYNNILKKSIRKAKTMYFATQFNKYKKDIKQTWGIINGILKPNTKKREYPFLFKINNQFVSDKPTIANHFNSFFASVGSSLDPLPPVSSPASYKHFLKYKPAGQFKFHSISVTQVEKIISDFVPKSSCGHDGIPSKLVKRIQTFVSTPLSIIINQSLATGIFPDTLKLAKVLPIFKKDDDQLFNSYRPISLLSVFSKIFEKVAFSQFYEYLNRNNLLYSSQHGFRISHSTETASYEFHDIINSYLDNNLLPISVHLDLSKAFDTLNHSILIDKLNFYGVSNTSLDWFTSYLTHRKQYIVFGDTISHTLPLNMGVPQGSVLGPLLFLVYINDIYLASESFHTILYADDSTLIFPLHSSSLLSDFESLNIELTKVFNWLVLNKLYLNASKTKYMLFHYPQKKIEYDQLPPVMIGGMQIERTSSFNFLGIIFQDTLSWKAHTSYVCSKVS